MAKKYLRQKVAGRLFTKKLIKKFILQLKAVITPIQSFTLSSEEGSLKSTCLCDRNNPELKATREIIIMTKIVFLEMNKLA